MIGLGTARLGLCPGAPGIEERHHERSTPCHGSRSRRRSRGHGLHARLWQRFRDRGAARRASGRTELTAALRLWALRRAVVGHRLYRPRTPQRAHMVLPHPPQREACGPLRADRHSPLAKRAADRPGHCLARPIPVGPRAPHRRAAYLADGHAHHDDGRGRLDADGHGEPRLSRYPVHARRVLLLGRWRVVGRAAGGAASLFDRTWRARCRSARDRDPAARAGLPGRGAGRPLPGLCVRKLRPALRVAPPWADRG